MTKMLHVLSLVVSLLCNKYEQEKYVENEHMIKDEQEVIEVCLE